VASESRQLDVKWGERAEFGGGLLKGDVLE